MAKIGQRWTILTLNPQLKTNGTKTKKRIRFYRSVNIKMEHRFV